MAKKVIKLSLSAIINDLENGLPWYATQDEGDGSIETKYGIAKQDVDDIREHPKLQGLEPADFTVIEIVDDLGAAGNQESGKKILLEDDTVAITAAVNAEPAAKSGQNNDLNLDFPGSSKQETADFANLL